MPSLDACRLTVTSCYELVCRMSSQGEAAKHVILARDLGT